MNPSKSLILKAIVKESGADGMGAQPFYPQQASAVIGSQFVMSHLLNYLVPSDGSTHTVLTAFTATAVGYQINWNQFRNDQGFRFDPQGAWIDNTNGAAALVATSQATGFSFSVAPGAYAATPFPAAPNDVWTITGNGAVKIFWVDFPVFPFGAGLGTTVAGSNVNVINVPTIKLPVNNAGAPYQFEQIGQAGTQIYGNAAGGGVALAAPANQNIRRLQVTVSGDAAIAGGGENLLVVTLNAVVIFEDNVYFPAAAPALPMGQMYSIVIPFDTYTFNAGAASNLQLGWGTALSAGKTSLQGWFSTL